MHIDVYVEMEILGTCGLWVPDPNGEGIPWLSPCRVMGRERGFIFIPVSGLGRGRGWHYLPLTRPRLSFLFCLIYVYIVCINKYTYIFNFNIDD